MRKGRLENRELEAVMGRTRRRAASSILSSVASSVVSSAASTPWSSRAPSRASSPARKGVFPFWALPAEIRLRIYEMVMLSGETIDLRTLPLPTKLIAY